MRALSTAIFTRLSADATLAGLIGATNSVPSVFAKRPIPTTPGYPYVLAATVVSDVDRDMVSSALREISRDIGVYGMLATQFDKVVDAAERVRALFHRQPLAFAGHRAVDVIASGPIDAPADPQEVGRIVTLTIRLQPV